MPLTCIFGGQCGVVGAPEGAGNVTYGPESCAYGQSSGGSPGGVTGLVGVVGLPSRT